MEDSLEKSVIQTVWEVSEVGYQMAPKRYLFESFDAAANWVRERRGKPELEFHESGGDFHPRESVTDHGFIISECPVYRE